MTDTLDTHSAANLPARRRAWRLHVAHHTDGSAVGRRVVVSEAPITLGRESEAFGTSVFRGGAISRTHARVHEATNGELLLEDLGSRNGTFVNSKRIQSERLFDGDVVAIGNTLLLATRDEQPLVEAAPPAPPAGFVARSAVMSAALVTARAAASRGPCLLYGASGSGKSTLASVLHETRAHASSMRTISGAQASFGDHPTPHETWRIESTESLSVEAQAQLLELLPVLTASNVALVCCSCQSPDELRQSLDPRLINRLSRWAIELPSLRRRRADIMPLAFAFAERYRGTPTSFDPDLSYALLRHAWPGNLHELEAVIERAVVETPDDQPIAPFPGLAAALHASPGSRELSSVAVPPSAAPTRIAADGSSFWTSAGEEIDLSGRDVLRRVLAAFVEAHQRWPGRGMTVQELVERGWPGERMAPKAGANRAYVALATLRKLGLRDVLIRDDGGYSLDTSGALEVD